MLLRFTSINVLLSIFMFIFIFYCYAGISGSDIAIISANIIFGLVQLLTNSIYLRIKKSKFTIKVQVTIIIVQVIELLTFLIYGYQINEYLKSN